MPSKQTNTAGTDAAGTLTALVLQGGGALGAYQAGACEALATRMQDVDWVAGVSIGAINAALIAGNAPEQRIDRLRQFWERVSLPMVDPGLPHGDGLLRQWRNGSAAVCGALLGIPGFFSPRPWWDWWPQPPASIYDTGPLRDTLLELVDFDRLNDGPMRFTVDAVDVESGNLSHFDNRQQRIRPEHVMASGALPPGFPAIRIDGRHYWDGGLVSNTPLAQVMEQLPSLPQRRATIFQVDLFSAHGKLPHSLDAVAERDKDIRYSSRTRLVSDLVRERHQLRHDLNKLVERLPARQREHPEVQALLASTALPAVTLVHVIHRRKPYESQNKDYEFSAPSMREHWLAGMADMQASLAQLDAHQPPRIGEFCVLDCHGKVPERRYGA